MSALLLISLTLTGCTAGRASYYLVDTDRAYRAAVEAGAEELAVYEYTMAWLYRDKAWEEWGYSDYEAAEKLALMAADYARQAEQIALYGEGERGLIRDLEVLPDQIDTTPPEEEEDWDAGEIE